MPETFELAACIGAEVGLSGVDLERFINFMEARFPKETDQGYINIWAYRFVIGSEFKYADGESRRVLLQVHKCMNLKQVAGSWQSKTAP